MNMPLFPSNLLFAVFVFVKTKIEILLKSHLKFYISS